MLDFAIESSLVGPDEWTTVATVWIKDSSNAPEVASGNLVVVHEIDGSDELELNIPWVARFAQGGIRFAELDTAFFSGHPDTPIQIKKTRLTNDFPFPVRIHNISFPGQAASMFTVCHRNSSLPLPSVGDDPFC